MKTRFVLGIMWGAGSFCLAGCRPATAPRSAAPVALRAITASAVTSDPLPLRLERTQRTAALLESLRKRIMGRRESLRDVGRIVTEVGPIVAEAAHQPEAEQRLRRMAEESGLSLETMRAQWIAAQEADLLLESGGDPDAVSISAAVGVAQWLAGTANAHGLPVNAPESLRLTRKIDPLKRQIAWDAYLLRPDADRAAPGAPALTPAEAAAQLPALRQQLEMLRAKRRKVDARYDPRQAIFAQTRYLLALCPRFPSLDWLFQAYHGGEAGVQRTLHKYLGHAWPGSAAAAIRAGRRGLPLRYEDLYFATTPRTRSDAFAYLYGRSDDHRYYWWKLRASEAALALYRRDPNEFRRQWEAYLPGRQEAAVWYPGAPAEALAALPDLRSACACRRLARVSARPEFTLRPAPLDPQNAACYAALRPEAKGALLLVATAYRRAGGPGRLQVGDMALTQSYLTLARVLHPPLPPRGPLWPPDPEASLLPGGGPPPSFDFHVTGLAFDLLRPTAPQQRKVLEYTLGYFQDRCILQWIDARDRGERRYHIVPNPRYTLALARISASGQAPALPGL
jgi:hypothetical protein